MREEFGGGQQNFSAKSSVCSFSVQFSSCFCVSPVSRIMDRGETVKTDERPLPLRLLSTSWLWPEDQLTDKHMLTDLTLSRVRICLLSGKAEYSF